MDLKEAEALSHLISIANQDTGQSRRVADFLLAWWNADSCGGFDLTDLWALDHDICRDVIVMLGLIVRSRSYPDTLGYRSQFEHLVRLWRPSLDKPKAIGG